MLSGQMSSPVRSSNPGPASSAKLTLGDVRAADLPTLRRCHRLNPPQNDSLSSTSANVWTCVIYRGVWRCLDANLRDFRRWVSVAELILVAVACPGRGLLHAAGVHGQVIGVVIVAH